MLLNIMMGLSGWFAMRKSGWFVMRIGVRAHANTHTTFLCAFIDRIKNRTADAWYVLINKGIEHPSEKNAMQIRKFSS